jgi:hypothetical protein
MACMAIRDSCCVIYVTERELIRQENRTMAPVQPPRHKITKQTVIRNEEI